MHITSRTLPFCGIEFLCKCVGAKEGGVRIKRLGKNFSIVKNNKNLSWSLWLLMTEHCLRLHTHMLVLLEKRTEFSFYCVPCLSEKAAVIVPEQIPYALFSFSTCTHMYDSGATLIFICVYLVVTSSLITCLLRFFFRSISLCRVCKSVLSVCFNKALCLLILTCYC